MCGIIAALSNRDVSHFLLQGLTHLEYRGYDSAGIGLVDHGKIKRYRKKGRISELENFIKGKDYKGNCGIAHTRWATHGIPTDTNAHPFQSNQRVLVVHNGIVENYIVLKKELIKEGFTFESETDSEVIAHSIMRYLRKYGDANEHALLKAVASTAADLKGAFAFCAIDKNYGNRIIMAKCLSPLVLGIGEQGGFVASDISAISILAEKFSHLENGNIAEIYLQNGCTGCKANFFDMQLKRLNRKFKKISTVDYRVELGQHKHYMHKEIWEQPEAICNTLEGRLLKGQISDKILGAKSTKMLDNTENIVITACGSSFHAALVAKYWLEEIARVPCQIEIASEYRYRRQIIPKNSLFIAISQSGETADILAAHKKAKENSYLNTLAVSNVESSSLVCDADFALLTHASPELGVASTKTFTTQLTVLLILTILFAKRKRGKEIIAKLVEDLCGLPSDIERALRLDEKMAKIAKIYSTKNHVLFLGRGQFFPIAHEGALKLKEISYIHAEGYAAGELKHGPLALIDKHMPSFCILPDNEVFSKTLSNIEEIATRGGCIHVLTNKSKDFYPSSKKIKTIDLEVPTNCCSPIVFTVPLQSLAYHTALLKGTDIDHPRNLAKSVTVE